MAMGSGRAIHASLGGIAAKAARLKPHGANHQCTAGAMRERYTRQIATHNRVMEHHLGTGEVPIQHSV